MSRCAALCACRIPSLLSMTLQVVAAVTAGKRPSTSRPRRRGFPRRWRPLPSPVAQRAVACVGACNSLWSTFDTSRQPSAVEDAAVAAAADVTVHGHAFERCERRPAVANLCCLRCPRCPLAHHPDSGSGVRGCWPARDGRASTACLRCLHHRAMPAAGVSFCFFRGRLSPPRREHRAAGESAGGWPRPSTARRPRRWRRTGGRRRARARHGGRAVLGALYRRFAFARRRPIPFRKIARRRWRR